MVRKPLLLSASLGRSRLGSQALATPRGDLEGLPRWPQCPQLPSRSVPCGMCPLHILGTLGHAGPCPRDSEWPTLSPSRRQIPGNLLVACEAQRAVL